MSVAIKQSDLWYLKRKTDIQQKQIAELTSKLAMLENYLGIEPGYNVYVKKSKDDPFKENRR